jgi:hypothetical protein
VFGDDLREELAVLAAVVAAERGAEAATEDEEVLPGRVGELAVDRTAGQVERPAEALVDGAKLGAERDQAVSVGCDRSVSLDPGTPPEGEDAASDPTPGSIPDQ